MFKRTSLQLEFFNKETCNLLFRFHRIKLTTIRHLYRLLRQSNLQRRGNHSNINTSITFIQDKLKGSSLCFGYWYMLQKLRSSGLTTDKETVRLILKSLLLAEEKDGSIYVKNVIHLVQLILDILMVMISWKHLG